MHKFKRIRKHAQMALMFAAVVFVIMFVGIFLTLVGISLLDRFGLLRYVERGFLLIYFALISLLFGTIIAVVVSRIPLKPLREMIEATERIADGDYNVRLAMKGPEELRYLNEKFNYMAEELGSVEMLRNDFVNSFSHEFKTPIVSIRGFAKILKWEDITAEERNEYLDIIIQESERLAELSTNVLSLSKIEQQTILTDKTRFNISEQIRIVIAMMDSRWHKKQITFQFCCAEVFWCGNEEMLKQVWINLLDNAIKFSPEGGIVKIDICENGSSCLVTVANQGEAIPPETAERIFDKFYQGDHSRATRGNGLGLTITKRIVQLHGGRVFLQSSDADWTVMTVELPDFS